MLHQELLQAVYIGLHKQVQNLSGALPTSSDSKKLCQRCLRVQVLTSYNHDVLRLQRTSPRSALSTSIFNLVSISVHPNAQPKAL
jgi:hypothetical protein